MIVAFTGKKIKFSNFLSKMFLSARKQNIAPLASTIRKTGEDIPKTVNQLSQDSPSELLSDSNPNFQIFQNQLKRISAICENQRRQKYQVEQDKNRVQNLLKVSEVEKTQLLNEKEKLRIQLTQMIKKMGQMQNKSNMQISELYALRAQKCQLSTQIHNLREYRAKYEEKCAQEQKLENKLQGLMQQLIKYKNDLLHLQIDNSCLKESMLQLSLENKTLQEKNEEKVVVDTEKLKQLEKQLDHWKNAFQSKQRQFQSKIKLMEQQNSMLKQTFEQFQNQNEKRAKCLLQKSCNLSSSLNSQNEGTDSFYMKLFAKQNQIQKLKHIIKEQQDRIVLLDLQNKMLQSKSAHGTILTTLTYNKYTDLSNDYLRNNQVQVTTLNYQAQLQAKEAQIELITQKLSTMQRQMESITFSSKHLLSEVQKERIAFENALNELASLKNRFQVETCNLKQKISRLEKECSEKDKIIISVIKKSK